MSIFGREEPPAHEIALSEIEKLKESNLLEDGQIKHFHFSLSEISRNYFERKYGLTVTDMTLEEIKARIDSIHELFSKSFPRCLRPL